MNVTALTNPDAVKGWLEISNTNSDTVLGYLIDAVSGACATYCNRNFGSASYTEFYNGNNQPSLFLNNRPITAVASVTIGGYSVPAQSVLGGPGFAFDSYRLYVAGAFGFTGFGGGRGFPVGIQNVKVVYTAGLAYTQSAFPDLWHAATEWVGLVYKAQQHIDKATESLSEGGTTTYLNKIPSFAKIVLDRYAQVASVSPLGY